MADVVARTAASAAPMTKIAALEYSELRKDFRMRVAGLVGRVFDSSGGPGTGDALFWNLSVTRNLRRGEIVDKPAQFVESIRAIYGAEARALEDALVEEMLKEFGTEMTVWSPNDETQEAAAQERPARQESFVDVLERAMNIPSLSRPANWVIFGSRVTRGVVEEAEQGDPSLEKLQVVRLPQASK